MMQNLIAALEKDIGDTCSYIYIYIHRERERYIYIYIEREREREWEGGREGERERAFLLYKPWSQQNHISTRFRPALLISSIRAVHS